MSSTPGLLSLPNELLEQIIEETYHVELESLSSLRATCRTLAAVGAQVIARTCCDEGALLHRPKKSLVYDLSDYSLQVAETVLSNPSFRPLITTIHFLFDAEESPNQKGRLVEPKYCLVSEEDERLIRQLSTLLESECETQQHRDKLAHTLSMAENLACIVVNLKFSLMAEEYAPCLRPRWAGFLHFLHLAIGDSRMGNIRLELGAFDGEPFSENHSLAKLASQTFRQISDLTLTLCCPTSGGFWDLMLLEASERLQFLTLKGNRFNSSHKRVGGMSPSQRKVFTFPELVELIIYEIPVEDHFLFELFSTSRKSLRKIDVAVDIADIGGRWLELLDFIRSNTRLEKARFFLYIQWGTWFEHDPDFREFCIQCGLIEETDPFTDIFVDVGPYLLKASNAAA